MSDPLDIVASFGGPAGAAVSVGAFMRWLSSKSDSALSTKLALMEQKLDQLVAASSKHEGLGERVALLEQTVKALAERATWRKR